MSTPALALAPVLVDDRMGAGASRRALDAQLLDRATRDDYQHWQSTALAAGGCVRPIRLRGTVRDIDASTGEILRDLDTADLPDKAIYVPCGDRRASVCPPCAETYRADTYQLIRAGLAGGKGMPESVAIHPCVFATFTAPSFGPVHTPRRHPRRKGRPVQAPPQGQLLPVRTAHLLRATATKTTTPAPASRCAQTATTTKPPSSGTRTPPSCGAAPSSASAAASTSSPKPTACGSSCPTPRSPSSSAAG